MEAICIIIIAILVTVGISIVINSKSTYVSTLEIDLRKLLHIKVSKKEKRPVEAHKSQPNTPKS